MKLINRTNILAIVGSSIETVFMSLGIIDYYVFCHSEAGKQKLDDFLVKLS